jgi:hypothetical protein
MLLNNRYSQGTWRSEPPYLYAKVLGIFHVNASLAGVAQVFDREPVPSSSHKIEFLWIQWYAFHQATTPFSLDRVFLRPPVAASLDFLEPAAALRAVHLIPQFSLGKTQGPTSMSRFIIPHGWAQWKAYYINK